MYSLATDLMEMNYKQIMAKQKSIVRLFPTFYSRVKAVAANGGARLINTSKDLWSFQVPSGDTERFNRGVKYYVKIYFADIPQVIQEAAKNKANWTTDGKHLNLNKLAVAVMYGCDLAVSSTSPGDQFWGPNYQRTQAGAEYAYDEDRPPVIRNPNEWGFMGKHLQLVFDVLPFYVNTMASILKTHYKDYIMDVEKQMIHKKFNPDTSAKPAVKAVPEVPNKKLSPKEVQQGVDQEAELEDEENPDEKIGL